jgi:CheY-like chemotaxis protein
MADQTQEAYSVTHFKGRFAVGMALLLALCCRAAGDEDNRQFFQKPVTPEDYWKRVKFEIEVGKFDFAATYLKGFLAALGKLKEDEANQELVKLEEKEGMSAFLRLRQLPELLGDTELRQAELAHEVRRRDIMKLENEEKRKELLAKDEKDYDGIVLKIKKERQAFRKDVDKLIKRVTTAVNKVLRDPKRITKFIKNLGKSREERAWAINELSRSGDVTVPYLIRELQLTEGKPAHRSIVTAMVKLDSDIEPPLAAALDIPDDSLRDDLLEIIRERGATSAVPDLWYLAFSPKTPAGTRARAGQTLAYLLHTRPDKLPSAKVALTRLADRYYRHQVKFTNPEEVSVWQYDPQKKELDEAELKASAAEEYYGLRYARRALDLDPTYRPAQVVFLSLALDKAYGGDFQVPLAKKAPAVKELMTTVNPALVADVLARGLREGQLPVILGAIQTLGDLADVHAARLAVRHGPVLARALNYPDRRVQMAAVDAMVRIPGEPPPSPALRVVQILRRSLLAEPVPKLLIAYTNKEQADELRKVAREARFVPVVVRNRRAALQRLRAAADIDAILIDYRFPGWEREFPFVLAAIRADVDAALIPVVVTAPENRLARLRHFTARYRNVWVENESITGNARHLKETLQGFIKEATGRPLTNIERQVYAATALNWLSQMSRGEIKGYDVQPAADAIYEALNSKEVETASTAIEMAGRLPGPVPQRKLALIVLDPARDKLRSLAAIHLSRQVQQNGRLLPKVQVKRLQELFATTKDAKLKANLALVIGSLRPNAKVTGKRLKDFQPPVPKENKEDKEDKENKENKEKKENEK